MIIAERRGARDDKRFRQSPGRVSEPGTVARGETIEVRSLLAIRLIGFSKIHRNCGRSRLNQRSVRADNEIAEKSWKPQPPFREQVPGNSRVGFELPAPPSVFPLFLRFHLVND